MKDIWHKCQPSHACFVSCQIMVIYDGKRNTDSNIPGILKNNHKIHAAIRKYLHRYQSNQTGLVVFGKILMLNASDSQMEVCARQVPNYFFPTQTFLEKLSGVLSNYTCNPLQSYCR